MAEVKLFGFWASPFAIRVLWALKLKQVAFDECVEEDLVNYSSTLLQYSHAQKRTPILFHQGRPIAESLVILEYIDETWKQKALLPQDTYDRAKARFWAKFVDDKVMLQQEKMLFTMYCFFISPKFTRFSCSPFNTLMISACRQL